MTEREMEDLLWDHSEKFLNEPLKQFQRQPSSSVGRADLIFLDRIGRLLVIELKRDTLERGAVSQIVDYFGMLKSSFPDKAVELMIIANRIPPERRLACEQFHIEAREIPQKKFRDVAEEVGYVSNQKPRKRRYLWQLIHLRGKGQSPPARRLHAETIFPAPHQRLRRLGISGRAQTDMDTSSPSSTRREVVA